MSEQRVIKRPYGRANCFHLPDEEGEPKYSSFNKNGVWETGKKEEIPLDLPDCQKCKGEVDYEHHQEGESLLLRARNGSPEDFGLERIPEV